jgi:hypothetical protein
MKKTALRPRPSLLLLWLTCAQVLSGCATTSPPATPAVCPKLPPPPSNVMREPNYVQRLQELLFESQPMPSSTSLPAKQ